MNFPMDVMIEQGAALVVRGGAAVLIYAAFHFGGLVLSTLFERVADKTEPERRYVVGLIAGFIRISLLLLGAVTALGTLGINVTALVVGLGLIGFALGFALKDMLSNLVSGILILLYQPFRVGDVVTVTGCQGSVQSIDLRYTILLTGDGKKVLVPNASIFRHVVTVDKTHRPAG